MSDFDLHNPENRTVLMDGAVGAAFEFLYDAIGDEVIMVGRLWHDLVVREAARMFSTEGTERDDGVARELNAALAAQGAPYRLTKGVA